MADSIVANAIHNPRRLFFIEIASALGIQRSEIAQYMRKKVGDSVAEGELLAQRSTVLGQKLKRSSPVEGTVERIPLASGHVLLREHEHSLEPQTVNVIHELELKNTDFLRYMKKQRSDLVEKGGAIAEMPLKAGLSLKRCKSPIYGQIVEVNEETGDVTIQRPHEKTELRAGIPGRVVEVIPDRGVVIETWGHTMEGRIGFGSEAFGSLRCLTETSDATAGCIAVSRKRISAEDLQSLKGVGVKGLIVGELNVSDLENTFGEEVYSGVTGKIDVGIVVVLLKGFGISPMPENTWDFFKGLEGSSAYLSGVTQMRAGVVRPEVIISTTTLHSVPSCQQHY
jgi:DNA-binding transcriptional MerR regulator